MSRLSALHSSLEIRPLIGLFSILFLLFALAGITPATAQEHQMQDMYPSKTAADKRDKDLSCTGDFKMGGDWMPCKNMENYEKSVNKEKR
jgi:hypothetical protein